MPSPGTPSTANDGHPTGVTLKLEIHDDTRLNPFGSQKEIQRSTTLRDFIKFESDIMNYSLCPGSSTEPTTQSSRLKAAWIWLAPETAESYL